MNSPKSPPQAAAPADAAASADATGDVALVHAVAADGGVQVIRRRGDRLEAGMLRPLREGAPIQGEVVSLRPRPSFPLLCDVQVHYTPEKPAATASAPSERPVSAKRKGPAQVATDSYRSNWDSIWSKKQGALN